MVYVPRLQSAFYMDIRFSDMNSQGHVSHEAIVSWVAHTRIGYIDSAIKIAKDKNYDPQHSTIDVQLNAIDYTLAHLQIDFKKQTTFPGEVRLDVTVQRIGKKSLTLKYILYGDDNKSIFPFAQAKSITVFFDVTTSKTIPIPDSIRKVLALEVV
jgi:acyl-CoA thioesterase FadM